MSGGFVAYHQRLNKAVERHLFMEMLSSVNRYKPVSEYTYVGFGGAFLEDFKLIHERFGNQSMISIEGDPLILKRQRFNKPLSCITCLAKTSGDFIVNYDIEESAIVWLDYANPRQVNDQLREFQSLLSKMQPFDILKLTLNADPNALRDSHSVDEQGKLENADTRNQKRLVRLRDRIKAFLPEDISPEQTSQNGLPILLASAVEYASSQALRAHKGMEFLPLTILVYTDTHQMLTVTGILLPESGKSDFMKQTKIDKWGLWAENWATLHRINLPSLTIRERLFIDRLLHKYDEKRIHRRLGFLFTPDEDTSLESLKNYVRFYRQYSSFHRVIF